MPTAARTPSPDASRRGERLRDDPACLRAVAALGAFSIAEQAVWVTVLVIAAERGGAGEAGWVSLALLGPAALVAPTASRQLTAPHVRTPLAAGYAIQTVALALAAAVLVLRLELVLFYGAAALVTVTTVTVRPAHHSYLARVGAPVPATVATGAVSGAAQLVGPLLAAVLVHLGGAVPVLIAATALSAAALSLTSGLGATTAPIVADRVPRPGEPATSAGSLRAVVGARSPAARRCILLLFCVLGTVALVLGAIETLATQVVGADGASGSNTGSTTGVLVAGVGGGLLVGAWWSGRLVTRSGERRAMSIGAACTAAGLLAMGAPFGLWWSLVAFTVAGVGMQTITVAGWLLLHRRVCHHGRAQVSTVFALLESQQLAANGVGALSAGLALGHVGWWPVLLVAAAVLPCTMLGISAERLRSLPVTPPIRATT